MTDKISKKKKNDLRNARRRKRRLEQHTGIDWIDPEKGYGLVRGEQALWRAVILQMLEDATNNSKKPQEQFARTQARNWLEGTHRDFATVCELAGFDISYVRKKVKQALLNHCQWRKQSKPNSKKDSDLNKKMKSGASSKTNPTDDQPPADILPFNPFLKKSA